MSKFLAGVIGIAVIVLFSYLAYTKFANPFASKYTVHAMFSSANGLRPDSLVRIAGINVGKVDTVEPVTGKSCRQAGSSANGCQAAEVTMEIDKVGLPVHTDATFNIRPRIFLEGNFFIDLHPGTPEAPVAPDGYHFSIGQGTEPVQLDQILSSLPADTRHNLQTLLEQYGYGVKHGGPSFNQSVRYWLPAYEYSSIVANDFLGTKPHDLSNWISEGGTVNGALDAHPQNLKSFVTDLDTTARAFARQQGALQQAVAELPRTLGTAIPAFNSLNTAFPPLRRLTRALIPATISTGPMIDVSLPFISQLRQLVGRSELRGLTSDLVVTVPALARLAKLTIPLMLKGVRPAASCQVNEILPWSNLTLNDPHFNASNGFPPRKVFQEAVDFLPGLAGESRIFDSNGPIVRVGLTGGSLTYSLSPKTFGQSLAPIGGVQPVAPPGHKIPQIQPNVPCETQAAVTDLSTGSQALSPVAAGDGKIVTAAGHALGLPSILPGLAKDQAAASRGASK
jgi:ABC-type transporter Mla subunit MlaD